MPQHSLLGFLEASQPHRRKMFTVPEPSPSSTKHSARDAALSAGRALPDESDLSTMLREPSGVTRVLSFIEQRDGSPLKPNAAYSDEPTRKTRRLSHEQLHEFCRRTLELSGSIRKNAEYVAEILVAADLRGITSHGVNRLELYCDELQRGSADGKATPRIESETAAVATVHGMNAQGAVVGNFAMELAIKKAREQGVGWVVAHHSNHYGIAGF